MTLRRRRWLWLTAGIALVLALPGLVHGGIVWRARLTPPKGLRLSFAPLVLAADGSRHVGKSETVKTDGLILTRLVGTPEEIGESHAKLLKEELIDTERRLLDKFAVMVPSAWARFLLMDMGRVRFRDIDSHMAERRLYELSAMAASLPDDPLAGFLPTYQRLVYLNALYDISLSFEESPLLGCTTFVLKGKATLGQHVLFARNFDFEIDPVFDENKTLFVVHETGQIPFASVAWPGLVGVVTGVNEAGLAVVVHGGRAGSAAPEGEPVIHSLRHVLSQAHGVEEAVDILSQTPPMVSHIAIMADATGNAVVLERVPGSVPYRYTLPDRAAVTNHLIGPDADDPSNQRVMRNTSTLARKHRGDQLVFGQKTPATVSTMIELLRDRRAVNDTPLPLGDRRAIDALIAAHGIVADLTAKKLYISHSPHLLGGFITLDLTRLFDQTVPLAAVRSPFDLSHIDPLLQRGEHPEAKPAEHPDTPR